MIWTRKLAPTYERRIYRFRERRKRQLRMPPWRIICDPPEPAAGSGYRLVFVGQPLRLVTAGDRVLHADVPRRLKLFIVSPRTRAWTSGFEEAITAATFSRQKKITPK